MRNLLYVVAVILFIGWLIGFFIYNADGVVHILLVMALYTVVLRVIHGKESLTETQKEASAI